MKIFPIFIALNSTTMGLFGLFKKPARSRSAEDVAGQSGPAWLEGFTQGFQKNAAEPGVWKARLVTPSGRTQFSIKYYGRFHEKNKNLIVGTDFAPAWVVAVDAITGEEILLFDGCRHGYDAMFCYTYDTEHIEGRTDWETYSDKSGNTVFQVAIETTNSSEYDGQLPEEVDSEGLIELVDGQKLDFALAKRNAIDSISITVTDAAGRSTEIVCEELA